MAEKKAPKPLRVNPKKYNVKIPRLGLGSYGSKLPVPRKTSEVTTFKKPGTEVVKYEEPKRGVTVYKGENKAVVPYKEKGTAVTEYKPKNTVATAATNVVARGLARAGLRGLGPVGALVGMTTPAGAGSDKPSGPLMKGNAKPATFGDKGVRKTTNRQEPKPVASKSEPKKAEAKSEKAAAFKAKRQGLNKDAKPASKSAPKPKAINFKANWKGAAPTAMQRRAGAPGQKRKPNIFQKMFSK